MQLSRRQFLAASSAGVLAAFAGPRLADARGLLVDATLDDVLGRALAAAKKAGATYADCRIHRRRHEGVYTREDHVTGTSYSESYGFGVRVIVNGAWGFAASAHVDGKEAERVAILAADIAKANARAVKRPVVLAPVPAHVDVWQTPLEKDPFKIPIEDKVELLLAINAAALKVKGTKFCESDTAAFGEWKLLATSDGAYLEQDITRTRAGYSVTAVDDKGGGFESRTHDFANAQGGWERVERAPLLADAPRIAEEALSKLRAPSVTPGKRALILDPSNLWLTIHESVGHPTELDRALGYEANYAGTSFATVDKLGKLKYGADIVNLYADKTTPGGLATCGYDDDGVKTQRWDLVKNGLFVGYQTTREQAGWIGEKASRGTCYAQDFASFPFQRMPNVSLAPGAADIGIQDIIAATEDGVYVIGDGSWSIDHQRLNFQFGGQMFYEVKMGKVTRVLKDVAYQANSLDFWRGCDMIGGPASWAMYGAMYDGKGEPGQSNAVSHGCPPARFQNVNILSSSKQGG